jgi:hypothetical protein
MSDPQRVPCGRQWSLWTVQVRPMTPDEFVCHGCGNQSHPLPTDAQDREGRWWHRECWNVREEAIAFAEHHNAKQAARTATPDTPTDPLREALAGLRDMHQPVWASPQSKRLHRRRLVRRGVDCTSCEDEHGDARKEPWVCQLCGTADGHWPCTTLDYLDDIDALLAGARVVYGDVPEEESNG